MSNQAHNCPICKGDVAFYAPYHSKEFIPFCGKVRFNRGRYKGKPIKDASDEYLAWLHLKANIDAESQTVISQEIDRRDRVNCRQAREKALSQRAN